MNDFVCMHNLLYEAFSFLVVHGPDFLETVVIALFKSLVLLLQILEPRYCLVQASIRENEPWQHRSAYFLS